MSSRDVRRLNAAGFSLIELMVVLLVIALLLAIVVPGLIASIPERNLVQPLERGEAQASFLREVLYWEHKVAMR